jgi:hypothetical protein
MFIAGMFTIPKWVVYGLVLPLDQWTKLQVFEKHQVLAPFVSTQPDSAVANIKLDTLTKEHVSFVFEIPPYNLR